MVSLTILRIFVTAIWLLVGTVLLGCESQDEQPRVAQATPIQIPSYTLVVPDTPTLSVSHTATPILTPTPVTDEDLRAATVSPEDIDSGSNVDSFTSRDLVELLPDDVVACLLNVLGEEAYAAALDTPLLDSSITDSIIEGCFASEEARYAWLVSLSLRTSLEQDERLSSESSRCLIPVAENSAYVYGTLAGVHVVSPTPEEYISGNIGILLCLTDDEAAILFANPGRSSGLPSPNELRCMNGELESLEPLEMLYIWREPDAEATRAVAAAAQQCGVEHGPWNLSAATRMCVRPIWDATNGLSVTELPPSPEEIVLGALESLLCHTDEETEDVIVSSSIEGAATPLPSELSCMKDRLGGFDALVMLMLGQEIDAETNERLSEAADVCGADLETLGPPGDIFP